MTNYIYIIRCILLTLCIALVCSCDKPQPHDLGVFGEADGGVSVPDNDLFDLPDIQDNGELIVLTMYGQTSYFEYKGADFGTQYMLADAYAKSIGVCVRVDVSHSQHELVEKLLAGEGDLVAYNLDMADTLRDVLDYCGAKAITHFIDSIEGKKSAADKANTAWAVRSGSQLLAQSLDKWLAVNEQKFTDLTTIKIHDSYGNSYVPVRHPRSPILNLTRGEISYYDTFFKRYASQCGWDWRLLAAQAYQESSFDHKAVSWAGAMGLMQLMPATAKSVGAAGNVFDPETNVRGAVRLINKLNSHYSSVHNPNERIYFILAAYNAGPGHVDDARNLARKLGHNPDVWFGSVDQVVLGMSNSEYYNDPVVRHGYFRGSETYNYVHNIVARWNEYKRNLP